MWRGALLVALVCGVAFALTPATASAAPPLLWQVPEGAPASGSGAGEIASPRGVAVNPIDGHVYMADFANSRIDEFTPWGEFVKAFGWKVDASAPAEELQLCTAETGCLAGSKGSGPGQFDGPEGLTVDSAGNLYVVDLLNQRVQKFDPDGNFVLAFGSEVNQDTNANLCTATSGDACGKGTTGTANGQFSQWPNPAVLRGAQFIDTGPDDEIYVGDENRIQIFDPEGVYQGQLPTPSAGSTEAIAVDSAGNVYFSFNQNYTKGGGEPELPNIYKHNGTSWSVFAETAFPKALATDGDDHLYAVDVPIASNNNKGAQRVVEYDATGKRLIPDQVEVEENEGKPSNQFKFFAQKPGFELSALATSNACNLESEDLLVAYLSEGAGQLAAYGPNPDPAVCPPPVRPPAIADQFASAVEEEAAVVRAQINSRFWPSTTYYVEYGTEPCSLGGCTAKPAPPGIELGSGSSNPVPTKGVTLSGLEPGTTYHYRFVARTVYEPGPGGEAVVKGVGGEVGVDGAEGEFTTPEPTLPSKDDCANQAFRISLSAPLPDCRAYELVSPVDKDGGDIVALINVTGFRASRFQSATSGDRFTYSTYAPFASTRAGVYAQQYISSRNPGDAWASESISPPRGRPLLEPGFINDSEFKAFSADLCQGWLRLDFEQSSPLDPDAVKGFSNLFGRDNCGSGAEGYEALTTVEAADSTRGVYSQLEIQGLSADGSEAAFVAPGKLTSDAPAQPGPCSPGTCQQRLYHHSAGGQLRYVCYLPNGTTPAGNCYAGNGANPGGQGRKNQLTGALSADGSRVFFNLGGALYLRLNADQAPSESGKCEEEEPDAACTIAIPGATGATFWAAAADGSRLIYETSAEALREYDVEEGTVGTIAASGALGVLGQSADATRAYFASTAVLAPGAVAGKPNLYYREAGEAARFVAVLSSADVSSNPVSTTITEEPIKRATRVSPGGLHAAFVSSAPLTGADNTDVISGEPDRQVFLYDAGAEEGEGRLICASCDPSGARPVGRNIGGGGVSKAWAAAWIPIWEGDLYPSRPLSDDGSLLFFNSFGPLVTRDTNGKQDIYQWQEAESKADCEAAGAERYLPASHGCLSLISSGESPQDSEFLDANPTGRDVFFATGASLLSHDPGQIDVYDAREGGGLPPPPGIGAECEGQACQSPAPAPELSTPASAVYRGPGDVRAAPTNNRCPKGKRKVRRGGRARCVPRGQRKGPSEKAKRHGRRHARR